MDFFFVTDIQTPMGFSLLTDSLPFCSFSTLLSPPVRSYYFHFFFNICDISLPLIFT